MFHKFHSVRKVRFYEFYNLKNFKNSNSAGFSLIEMLLYVFLLSLLLIVVINSILLIVTSYRNIKAGQAIESSASASMTRMMSEIRNATSIDPNSSFGVNLVGNSGFLLLNTSTTSPTQVKFYVSSSSALVLDEAGIYSGPLTTGDSRLKTLIFRSINASSSQAVKIELEIESGTSTNYRAAKFYDTAILRGSYF